MRHFIVVYGRMKGHGRMRRNRIEHREEILSYDPVLNRYNPKAWNVARWFVENYKGLGPFPEELK